MNHVRLTTAQALIRFLDRQFVEFDGIETKFVKGVFTIFGHGNVLGIGQALEQDAGRCMERSAAGCCHQCDDDRVTRRDRSACGTSGMILLKNAC